MKGSGDILDLVEEFFLAVCFCKLDERLLYLLEVERDLAKRLRVVVQTDLLKLQIRHDLQGRSDDLSVVVRLELLQELLLLL